MRGLDRPVVEPILGALPPFARRWCGLGAGGLRRLVKSAPAITKRALRRCFDAGVLG